LTAAILSTALIGSSACQRRAPAPTVPPASSILDKAIADASTTHRVVLVEFGASWCQWCGKFDAFTKASVVKDVIAKNYVVTHLTVEEHDDKASLDNPGGDAFKSKWGGANAGLPFYVFLDGKGTKIADSNAMPNGLNIGFPAVPAERDAFMTLIDRTAPSLDGEGRQAVLNYLNASIQGKS
jgi:hypothetical protein